MRKLTDKYYKAYISTIDFDLDAALFQLKKRDWTIESFRFYTAVSVISSARIEGEELEVDSYLKHKLQDIEYLPELIEKPNDLFSAYEFARDHALTFENFIAAHRIATQHLLPAGQRGEVRKGNMIIMDQQTHQVIYEAAEKTIVAKEFEEFWSELDSLMHSELNTAQIFYYASLIHLVFVKIHPFNDGNGRAARLLEKWFLTALLGEKAWYIASENYYYRNLKNYYKNLQEVGLFYNELNYDRSIPFLCMLPYAVVNAD